MKYLNILGTGALVTGMGFLLWQVTSLQSEVARLKEARIAPQETSVPSNGLNGRPAVDPYKTEQVKNRIIKGSAELQTCYQAFLKTNPSALDGKVVVDWQIQPEGLVQAPEIVQSTFQDVALEQCLTQKISAWTFPAPPTGRATYISHSFSFKS